MEFTLDWGATLAVGGVALCVYVIGLLAAGLVRAIVTPKPKNNEEEK